MATILAIMLAHFSATCITGDLLLQSIGQVQASQQTELPIENKCMD